MTRGAAARSGPSRPRDEPAGEAGTDPGPSHRPRCGRGICGPERGSVLEFGLWPSPYRAATAAATPLVRCYLRARAPARQGGPGAARRALRHRRRLPGRPGTLVWVHAASVGEAHSVLALIDRLLAERPGIEMLMTTGTVASARLLAGRVCRPRPAPIRAGRPAARRRAVSRPLAARSGDLGRIRAVAQSGARDAAPRHPDAAAQRPAVGALVRRAGARCRG